MAACFRIGLVCTVGVGPDRGGRAENQDNYLVCRDREARFLDDDREKVQPADGDGVLVAVADGMGGHEAGAMASGAAVRALTRVYGPGPANPEEALHEFVLKAHRRLRARVAQTGDVRMGTTLCTAWVLDGAAYWCNVGDSRIYHERHNRLTLLSRDQTQGEFARRDNRPPPSTAGHLAQNFIFGSRGMGDPAAIRLDRGVDTGCVPLKVGDRLMLCSDGLTRFIDDQRLADIMREVYEPSACASWLVDRAIARGSDDNITILLLRVDDLDPESPRDEWEDDEDAGFEDGLVPGQ